MAIVPGSKLGPYEILAPLGAGGMGEVYRARDPRLDREVAIKVLPERLAGEPVALERFAREARAVAALSHPNILAIHDVGRQEDISYAVTELLVGSTLRGYLAGGALPWRKAVEIGIPIAEGLAAAHARGIVHRDLKPENVFVTSDGRVKILDFGLARREAPPRVSDGSQSPTSPAGTEPGMLLGTVGYMAPEQVRGLPADARSDIFALGCVLYETVTGARAFSRPTPVETLTAILRDDPPALGTAGREVPANLDGVVRHCLEKNPEERYQSARDLAFALKSVGSGSGAVAPSGLALDSLAVLPFSNLSGDPDAEYLCDGITESIMNALSQVPQLKVIARSSVFRYKGADPDPPAVARELSVRAVLTGRVLQRGERLSVSVALVDARENQHLWGEQYNLNLSDIFAVQEDIAREIAGKLRPRLSTAAPGASLKRYTENTEAYQMYLRGRYFLARRPQPEFAKCLGFFQNAIEIDPLYALAHAGIADYYAGLGSWESGAMAPREAFPRAKAAARRALEIDQDLAEAHSAYAYTILHYEWDWAASEREFLRAIELNPNYAQAHHHYSHLLLPSGRTAESLAESLRCLEIDPLDIVLNAHLSWHYIFSRQFDLAVEQCRRTFEISDSFWPHFFRGFALEQKGDLEAASADLEKAASLSSSTFALAAAGHCHAIAGRPEAARARLAELEARRYTPAYDLAVIHAGLGEIEQALAGIEKAFEERSSWMVYLGLDPRLNQLRADSRFRRLVQQVGLTT